MPAALVNAPPFTEYWPPEILIGATSLMPEIVTLFEITSEPNSALVTWMKLNESGVVSAGIVVTVKLSPTPPIVTVERIPVLGCGEVMTLMVIV